MVKLRTKKFAVEIIRFCESLDNTEAPSVFEYQLVESTASSEANYRAAYRGRAKPEFFSEISIVMEEVDESEYWLEIIEETKRSDEKYQLKI